jgi:hypothetical protein
MPTGPYRWRHVPSGRRSPRRSRWLSPVTLDDARRVATYADFVTRFPAVAQTTTEADWRAGRQQLVDYAQALAAARRRRRWRGGENPYLDLVQLLGAPSWRLPPGVLAVLDLPRRRRELAALFSWAIPNQDAIDTVARHAPIVECGAGMAYWSSLLRASGVDAIACDVRPPGGRVPNPFHPVAHRPWVTVEPAASVSATRQHSARTMLLSWPPYDDDDASYSALRAYQGEVVIYVGEGAVGSSGTARFHRELALNPHLRSGSATLLSW